MAKLKSYSLLLAALLALAACSGGNDPLGEEPGGGNQPATPVKNENANNSTHNPFLARLEFPRTKGGNSILLLHRAQLQQTVSSKGCVYEYGLNYATEWDTQKKSQRWSCYQLYKNIKTKNVERYYSTTNQYPRDPLLDDEYYFSTDPFRGSGYDHGHICPSADRLGTSEANIQTFYLTNMQPMLDSWGDDSNGFNEGIWADMEAKVRSWDNDSFRDTLFVCKGGTIDDPQNILETRPNGLIVPKYYFMAVLCKYHKGTQVKYKAMAFYIEHKLYPTGSKLAPFIINIHELEQKTDIDFFCNLPDDIEREVENLDRNQVLSDWNMVGR